MGGGVLMNCRLLRPPGAVKQPTRTHRSLVGRLSRVKVSFIASLLAFSLPAIAQPVDLSRPLVAEPAPPLQNKRKIRLLSNFRSEANTSKPFFI